MMALTREQAAVRAARELEEGLHVDLGIGIPTLVANEIPNGIDVTLDFGKGIPAHSPRSGRHD